MMVLLIDVSSAKEGGGSRKKASARASAIGNARRREGACDGDILRQCPSEASRRIIVGRRTLPSGRLALQRWLAGGEKPILFYRMTLRVYLTWRVTRACEELLGA